MDGIQDRENVFVIAATNNLSGIDPALRRSGRFDRVVVMPLPDKDSRYELYKYYLGNQPGVLKMIQNNFIIEMSTLTEGFSAADIKNLVNEATMTAIQETIASKKNKDKIIALPREDYVTHEHLLKALSNLHEKLSEERKATIYRTNANEPKLLPTNILRKKCEELRHSYSLEEFD